MPISTLLLTLSLATPLPQLDEAKLDRGALSPTNQLELGRAWLDRGKAGRAARHFQEVLSRERPSGLADQAALGLAEALLRRDRGEEALFVIERQRHEHPQSPLAGDALFQQARVMSLLRHPRAVDVWKQVIQELAGTPKAEIGTFALAWALQGSGQHSQAVTAFDTALRQFPDSPHADEARVGRADSLWETGDGVAAGQAYREAGERQNNPALVARGHFLLAEGWLKRGQPALAIEALQRIQAVEPYDAMARYQLGWLYLRDGRDQEAKRVLAPFLSSGENGRAQGLYLYGLALLRLNDPAGALPPLLISREEAGTQQWQAWYLSLLAQQKTARYEALAQDAKRLLELQPAFELAPQVRLLLADGLTQVKQKQAAVSSQAAFGPVYDQYRNGWSQMQAGNFLEAEKAFGQAALGLTTDALKADAWYRLALCRQYLGRWKSSEEALIALIRRYPEQPLAAEGAYQLAYTQYRMDRFESAAASFQGFVNVFPEHHLVHEARYWRGMAFFRARRYNQATAAFDELARLAGTPEALAAKAALQLADAYYSWGKLPQAVDAYRIAFNRPQPQAAAGGYAQALLSNGDTPEAREVLLKALEVHPDDPRLGDLLNRVGEAQFRQRLYLDAIHSLASHPRPTPDTWYWLGRAQRMAGKTAEALESLARIMAPESPFHLQALFEMAQIQLDQRAYPAALGPLETLLQAKPDASLRRQSQLSYAFALKETGRSKDSEEAYRNLLKLPGITPSEQRTAWHHLATLATQRGDYPAASRHYLEEVRLWPQPSVQAAEAQFWAGHALATSGDLKGAISLLHNVAALSPPKDPTWTVQALFKQGDVLEEQRRWKEALETYRWIVSQHGQNANWKADAEARVRWILQHIPAKERA